MQEARLWLALKKPLQRHCWQGGSPGMASAAGKVSCWSSGREHRRWPRGPGGWHECVVWGQILYVSNLINTLISLHFSVCISKLATVILNHMGSGGSGAKQRRDEHRGMWWWFMGYTVFSDVPPVLPWHLGLWVTWHDSSVRWVPMAGLCYWHFCIGDWDYNGVRKNVFFILNFYWLHIYIYFMSLYILRFSHITVTCELPS